MPVHMQDPAHDGCRENLSSCNLRTIGYLCIHFREGLTFSVTVLSGRLTAYRSRSTKLGQALILILGSALVCPSLRNLVYKLCG